MFPFGDTTTLCRRVLLSWIMNQSSGGVEIITGLQNCNNFTTTTILWLSGLCLGQLGWATTTRNIHPFTPVVVINHPLSASSIYSDPWHPLFLIYVLDSLLPQSFSKFSMVYYLAWHPPLHYPYISSLTHCLLFTAHAHTIATCFAVVPRLCHLILVCLSTLNLELNLIA